MLKNGNNHLKNVATDGRRAKPVWYSHLSKNRKPLNVIAEAMIRRLQKYQPYQNTINLVIFYDNKTNTEYKRIKF